jgi:phosphatidylserine/phosphatidylglycerophosphate/cardiolipin synthase-like enzyme
MVFISYSHVDTKWLTDLLTMAAPFVKFGGMRTFSDADIGTGASWRSTILKALDEASVAVLLVSPYFFNSAFIMDVELPRILKARQDRGLERVATVNAVLTVGFSFESKPHPPRLG